MTSSILKRKRPRGSRLGGGENTKGDGFQARTDGHRSNALSPGMVLAETVIQLETSTVCDFLSAMMMAETHIDCCVSNYVQAEIIPNVNKSADAQPDYRVMTHVIKTSVDWSMMHRTSDNECVGLAFAAPEFGPRKLDASLGGSCMIDGSFFALNWQPTEPQQVLAPQLSHAGPRTGKSAWL